MRLLLLADQPVGAAITAWLLEHYREDVALVIATAEGPVSEAARSAAVPFTIFQNDAQVEAEARRVGGDIDLGVLAWWPTLIHEPLLSMPRSGFVNTHPSLLPHNRGRHYNFWAIVEQAPFGVSLHMVTADVDAGDVVAQRSIDYDWQDTGKTLYDKAGAAMVQLFQDSYASLRTLKFPRQPQPPTVAPFHRSSELEAASRIELDASYTARELLNVLRARTFPPHPACWFVEGGETYEVRVEISVRKP